MKKPHFQFPITEEEYRFLTEHQMVPVELQNLCRTALCMIGNERSLVLDQDQSDDLWDFCMNFAISEGLTEDGSITSLGGLAEHAGDNFFVEGIPLLFSELERLRLVLSLDQEILESLEQSRCSHDPEFLLGMEIASLLRDLCIAHSSKAESEADKIFLQMLIDRFYLPNRVK